MINVSYIISRFETIQFFDGKCFAAAVIFSQFKAVISVENLMIGIECNFQVCINKTFVE
ncbi:MAG: hypothetical protein FNNCIFGK_00306 [Bacteroidia bacterium]|nr:hypothetical protein [Bacteroidia bacterium]